MNDCLCSFSSRARYDKVDLYVNLIAVLLRSGARKAFFASKHGQYEASSFQDDSALDFDQFRVFLDLNPYLRTMFLEALNPQMWAIDPIGKTLPKSLYNEGTILDIEVET